MFTLIAFAIIVVVAFIANREQNKDTGTTDDFIRQTRQDIRVIAWLLAGVVVMLGIVADRIH